MNKLWLIVLLGQISLSCQLYGLATTVPESPIVSFQVSGKVTDAMLEGEWGNLGMTNGANWRGVFTYDISALDILWSDPYAGYFSFPPAIPPNAYFRLWINDQEFSMYHRFEVWTSYDEATGLLDLGCSHNWTEEGSEIYTPWELALGQSLNGGPDTYLLQLFDLNVISRAPDSLPYDMEFAEGGFGQLHMFGSLSPDNNPENADAFDYKLGVDRVVLVPEPSLLAWFGIGLMTLMRGYRSSRVFHRQC